MSWMGAVAAFAGAIAVVGVGLIVYAMTERHRRGPEKNDTGTIGCGVILFVVAATMMGAVIL